jgi:phosphonate transport system ATP-binding protein
MIEFVHAGKIYPNGVKGLKDVNLKIEQGEFVAIIGLSGAGKSTLIRTINRMINITSGKVIVDGVNVMTLSGKTLRRFRRHIGMIFQSFNLVTRSTVIKNVLTSMVPDMNFFRVLLGIFTNKQEMAALKALDKVGILDKAYTRCDQLSGGQQQRVALARTLNQNPSIILADEPVAALDPVTANQVMSDFKRINKEMNITILINIHHVDLALDYADRVIGIRAGEIVYDGSVKDVTQDVLDIIYNGAPVPKAAEEQSAKEAALIAETKAKTDAKQGAAKKEAQL